MTEYKSLEKKHYSRYKNRTKRLKTLKAIVTLWTRLNPKSKQQI